MHFSVSRRLLGVIDHEDLNRSFCRRELQAELFLDSCKD
jgi:hypothetical protein